MDKPKITIRKAHGDDAYSWSVFINKDEVYSGCCRSEAQHLREVLKKRWKKVEEVA